MSYKAGRHSSNVARMLPVYLSLIVGIAIGACGPKGPLAPHTVSLTIPKFPLPISGDVGIPRRDKHKTVPLVIVLDDGPPVDNALRREQARRIGQLASMIYRRGYALWRPLKNAWPTDSILVRCPDELTSQVQLGLLSAKEVPAIDRDRIVVLGFGQGGVIGTMVTTRTDTLVHALGLIGTPARSVDRAVASPALRDSVALVNLQRKFADLRAGLYPSEQVVLSGRAECWRSWMTITERITSMVASMPQPVLAIQGTADVFLPLLDIERFRRAIRGRPHSVAHSAVGVRHDLRDAVPDPEQDQDVISPRLVPLIMQWLDEVAPARE